MAVKQRKTKQIAEFGDFQTPVDLAHAAVKVLSELGFHPRSIVEPTCGRGSFVAACAKVFPYAETILGVDINPGHLADARSLTASIAGVKQIALLEGDFFKVDWKKLLLANAGPWMIVGNPPWVTSAELGSIESTNIPEKSNFHGRSGMDAITGKSNFDISEWMLLRYLDWLQGSAGVIAVLCKTAVARKILLHTWKKKYPLNSARIYMIDALSHFSASVDACFFVLDTGPNGSCLSCDIFGSLKENQPTKTLGFADGHLISDMRAFSTHRELLGPDKRYVWRSGIKHDCSKVMELTPAGKTYLNGFGETVTLEDTYLFPMMKSSDVGNGRAECRGVMLVTQRAVGEETRPIKASAPQTWDYLQRHGDALEKRGSSIYRNKPAYSIFGVGTYTFSPWKIAISGFYKSLKFLRIGPVMGRPVVFDDTVNFLPCWSEEEAVFLEELLTSRPATEFYQSMIQWDEKRPLTVDLLRRLNIRSLASMLGREADYRRFSIDDQSPLMIEAAKRERLASSVFKKVAEASQ